MIERKQKYHRDVCLGV